MSNPEPGCWVVQSLWRYPVKSMQGEALRSVEIGDRGLRGDRAYAIQDALTGDICSAKHPRKWAKLLACRAAFVAEPPSDGPLPAVRITLPDGGEIRSDEPDVDARLSEAVGRPVALICGAPSALWRETDRSPLDRLGSGDDVVRESFASASPPGTFFDYAPVHLLTTATLAQLQIAHPAARLEVPRFRPNIVIDTGVERRGFVEDAWLGRQLSLGRTVRLRFIDPCPRCVMTTLAQGDLPQDAGILRAIHDAHSAPSLTAVPGTLLPAVAGTYADVRAGGIVACRDAVALDETG